MQEMKFESPPSMISRRFQKMHVLQKGGEKNGTEGSGNHWIRSDGVE